MYSIIFKKLTILAFGVVFLTYKDYYPN